MKVLDNFTLTLFDKFFYNIICNRQPFWNLRKNPAKKKRNKNLSNNSSNLQINLPRKSWKGRARFLRISHWNPKITVKDQKKSSKFSAFWGTYLDFDSSFISNGPQPGLAFWVSSTKVKGVYTSAHWLTLANTAYFFLGQGWSFSWLCAQRDFSSFDGLYFLITFTALLLLLGYKLFNCSECLLVVTDSLCNWFLAGNLSKLQMNRYFTVNKI